MATVSKKAVCLLGARTIQTHLKALRKQIKAARHGKDVDAIHDMRVASRRLRCALTLFEPCCSEARTWRKAVRRVTRALSSARDLDVQIEWLKGFCARHAKRHLKDSLGPLLRYLRKERNQAQRNLAKTLDKPQTAHALKVMRSAITGFAMKRLEDALSKRAELRRQGRAAIRPLVEAMLVYERYLVRPECVEQLHQMRIAVRRLRYTFEFFAPAFGGELDPFVDHTRAIQGMLGEIHDCDMWVQFLPEFLSRLRRKAKLPNQDRDALAAAVEYVRLNRQRQRVVSYERFVRFWGKLRAQAFWADLRRKA